MWLPLANDMMIATCPTRIMAAMIGTWSFSLDAIQIGKDLLTEGCGALDAIEKAIAALEDDYSYGVYYVGRGGCPNASGQLECDAALMDGRDLSFGAVAAVQGVATPVRVARRVMDRSAHSMLVGPGAAEFAVKEGFVLEPNHQLVGEQATRLYQEKNMKKTQDTLGLIARDKHGNLAVGVSTSGIGLKSPGRVGDSSLPGCGLYADNNSGAACTTGDGDELLRFCPSYLTVRLMSEGLHPRDACVRVVREVTTRQAARPIEIGVVAMNKEGAIGAAGSVKDWQDVRTSITYPSFPYGVWSEQEFPSGSVLTNPQC